MFDHANGYLSPASAMDAEEFFQAKRDAELERWRWPENPEYVVSAPRLIRVHGVRNFTYRQVRVLHEPSMDVRVRPDRSVNNPEGQLRACGSDVPFADAARAYFEAHPERKPWHEARLGEIWAVTIRGAEHIAKVISPRDGISEDAAEFAFLALDVDVPDWVYRESEWITAGRRVWPEDAS